MMIKLKTDTHPACHGIACPLHSRCSRWHAVEKSAADPHTIGTCLEGEGFPEFVEFKQPLVELAAQSGHA